jgi:hypothetical protein
MATELRPCEVCGQSSISVTQEIRTLDEQPGDTWVRREATGIWHSRCGEHPIPD